MNRVVETLCPLFIVEKKVIAGCFFVGRYCFIKLSKYGIRWCFLGVKKAKPLGVKFCQGTRPVPC